MLTDSIVHGETYDLTVTAKDPDGVVIDLDAGWSAACRVCSGTVGGPTVADVAMTITDSTATGAIDTAAALEHGTKYYLDVRFTDPDGRDYWSDPWVLRVKNHNTPHSA